VTDLPGQAAAKVLQICPGLFAHREVALVITYLLSQVLDGVISTANIEADGGSTQGEEAQERAMSKQHNGCRYLQYAVVCGKKER
jgi:hypothetical protein